MDRIVLIGSFASTRILWSSCNKIYAIRSWEGETDANTKKSLKLIAGEIK